MKQLVKTPSLSSTPGSHVVQGEKQLLKVVLCPPCAVARMVSPIISAPRSLRQDNHKFEDSLGYISSTPVIATLVKQRQEGHHEGWRDGSLTESVRAAYTSPLT